MFLFEHQIFIFWLPVIESNVASSMKMRKKHGRTYIIVQALQFQEGKNAHKTVFYTCFMGSGGSEFLTLIGKIILLDIDIKKSAIVLNHHNF